MYFDPLKRRRQRQDLYLLRDLYFLRPLYISIYIYIYIYIEKRTQHSAFFCKRTKRSHFLLRSLQKNVAFFAFFAFFYILCKRTHRSFGLHKSPKTQKKNGKECCVLSKNGKERNIQNGKERGAQPWLTPYWCLETPANT